MPQNTRRIIGLDVDGVLLDFVGHTVQTMRARGFTMREPEEYKGWSLQSAMPPEQAVILPALWRAPGWCSWMPALPGAVAFVRDLRCWGEVVFVTSPMPDAPHWHHERTRALSGLFGARAGEVIFTHRKDLVSCDVLIDDKIEHVNDWSMRHARRGAILFETPHNVLDRAGKVLHPLALAVSGYSAVLDEMERP